MAKDINFDELRRQIDIVSVISSYITLTKKGKNYVGICPFHDDSNPSLCVSPERQIFKCFTCGTGGNVFTFIRDFEHVSFLEAVKKACNIAGIKAPDISDKQTIIDDKNKNLYDALKEAETFYAYNLKTSSGLVALDYLKSRNLDSKIIEKFKIGYAPIDPKTTTKYLQAKGFSLDDLIYSGVSKEINGEVYDFIKGRVTFAICDTFGRVVGFSGRRLNESEESKYINTSETAVFKKGNILYNYYNCEKVCRRIGVIYIVEGFMDAIALSRAGVDNVIATMGVALTNEHANLIKKLNCEVHLLFDDDRAGQKAIFDSSDILVNNPKPIRVVKPFNIEGCKDSDEIINKFGKDKLLELLKQTTSVLEFKINYLYKQINADNYEDRKEFVIKSAKLLGDLNDEMDKDYYTTMISKMSGFSSSMIAKYIPIKASVENIDEPYDYHEKFVYNEPKKVLTRYEKIERQIIKNLLDDPIAAAKYENEDIALHSEANRRLANYLLDYYTMHGEIVVADVLSELPNDLSGVLLDIIDEKYPPMELEDLFKIIKEDLPKEMDIQKDEETLETILDPHKQAEFAKQQLLKEGIFFSKKKKK